MVNDAQAEDAQGDGAALSDDRLRSVPAHASWEEPPTAQSLGPGEARVRRDADGGRGRRGTHPAAAAVREEEPEVARPPRSWATRGGSGRESASPAAIVATTRRCRLV